MRALVITCGLMGSGKSTVARALADAMGAELVSSDLVRKELAGLDSRQHAYVGFDAGIYSADSTQCTYERLCERAEEALAGGRPAVLDACFGRRWQRALAREAARRAGASFLCVEVECPDEEIHRRLDSRQARGSDASDGRWELFADHKARFEPVGELACGEHLVVDGRRPAAVSARAVVAALRRRA